MSYTKDSFYLKIFIATIICILGLASYAFMNPHKDPLPISSSYYPTENTAQPTPTPLHTTSQTIITQTAIVNDDLYYLKDNQIWYKSGDKPEVQITKSPNKVMKMKYKPGDNYVVYMLGAATDIKEYDRQVLPIEVFLYDIEKKQHRSIYSEKPKQKFDNDEYLLMIQDIEKSSDEELIIITTTDSIFTYTTTTAQLERKYHAPITTPERSIIYRYYKPKISPDKNAVLLKVGYYEGSSDVIVDIHTGKRTDLPYTIYGIGNEAIGWYNNQTLLIQELLDYDQHKDSLLRSAPITNPEQLTTIMQFDGFISGAIINGDVLYTTHQESKVSAKPDPHGYTYYDTYHNITVFNLADKTVKTLYSSKEDDETPNAVTYSFNNLQLSTKTQTLYISGAESININPQIRDETIKTIFGLNLTENASLEKIITNASF